MRRREWRAWVGRVGVWLLWGVAWMGAGLGGWAWGRALSVSEIHYGPPGGADYEFIELINSGTAPVVLTGAKFTNGIEYQFTQARTLAPGGLVVIARDRAAFTSRYGNIPQLAESSFKGKLDDQGEELSFVSAGGELLFRVKYDSSGDWPSRPNGLGSSLECVDPNGTLNDADNWRASAEYNGSPGRLGVGPLRTVVINEVLAHTDPPLEDAIELYNLTSQPIDVSGWYLSNSRENPKKYRIPKGVVVPAKGFQVFYQYQFGSGTFAEDPFTINSAHGDEVVLLAADASGNPTFWVDTLTVDASENGYSFGRSPDGTGPWVTLSALSFGTAVTANFPESFLTEFRKGKGAANALPRVGPVVFSRIQYREPAGQYEFLELQNVTTAPVPLFDPLYPANTWKVDGGVTYVFPTGITLPVGGTVIVCSTNPAAFRLKHNVAATVPVYGPWAGLLNNSGERVSLYKPDPPQLPPHPDAGFVPQILVDELEYDDEAPWASLPEPAGFTLKRKALGSYGNTASNWELESVIPPFVPFSVAITRTVSGGVRLSFNGQAGRTYGIETRAGWSGAWTRQATVPAPAASGPLSYEVSAAALGNLTLMRVVTP